MRLPSLSTSIFSYSFSFAIIIGEKIIVHIKSTISIMLFSLIFFTCLIYPYLCLFVPLFVGLYNTQGGQDCTDNPGYLCPCIIKQESKHYTYYNIKDYLSSLHLITSFY